MGTEALNAQQVDHGTAAGAHQALNALAMFRTGPMVGCVLTHNGTLVFAQAFTAPKTLCGCANPECRVDALFDVWQELQVASGEHSDVQCELAYLAYRVAQNLCLNGPQRGLHIPGPRETMQQRLARWAAEDLAAGIEPEAPELDASPDFGGDIDERAHDGWKDSDGRRGRS